MKQSATGEGLLYVMEDGEVWIAVSLDAPFRRRDVVISKRIIRVVPRQAEDTSSIPSAYFGRLDAMFDSARRTITVRLAEIPMLFRFTVRQFSDGESVLVEDDGTVVISAVEMASCNLVDERVSQLTGGIEDTEAVLDLLLVEMQSPDYVGDETGTVPPDCKNCQAGGQGATECSIGGCPGVVDSCQVACGSGYYACCKCKPSSGASCKCCLSQTP